MEKLIVKNFGPIIEIDIELKKTIVFIGNQSTGKSVLAKLISIFRDKKFILQIENLHHFFSLYQLDSFVNTETHIRYESNILIFNFKSKFKDFTYFNKNLETIIYENIQSKSNYESYNIEADEFKNLTDVYNKLNNTLYVPAERSFTSYAIGSLAGLILNNILIPKTILYFVSEFEKARSILRNVDLKILNIKYEQKNGDDFVVLHDKTEVLLKNSSSGYQSVVPLLMVIENNYKIEKHATTFVVEEPELNLFPEIQKKIIYYLLEKCTNINHESGLQNELIITTHSPYTLTSINNLLLAFQTAKKTNKTEEIIKIIPQESWINPENFVAYSLANGFSTSIFDENTKLISESELDVASEIIMQDFYDLMELYKNDK